ncbi:LysR family transcriptional regulator [Kibdelosporangium lantanae]
MLDVHRLRLLRELHARGTITAVAVALGYSGSAVSQQLAQLEREAGVQLLERVGRGVRLTSRALILVKHADAVLRRLERAEAELAASLTAPQGTLRIAAFQTAMLALVPPLLDRLRALAPDLTVRVAQLEPEPALSALSAGECDLVVVEEFPGHPQPRARDLDQVDLGGDTIHLVLPKSLRNKEIATLGDLADEQWALEPEWTPSGRWVRARCREAGFEPDTLVTSADILVHLRLVETGHVVAVLPDLVWTGRRPTVPVRPMPGAPVHRRLYTSARTGNASHPAVVLARNLLAELITPG